MKVIRFISDWWHSSQDRRAVSRLIRHYRKHPEHLADDSEMFSAGRAGYEEEEG